MTAAKNVKLATLIDRVVRQFAYTYDMGDDWRHTITVETVGSGEPDVKYPRFVDGARRCPPEDVGGLHGFEVFLDAVADPAHEEHDRLREWYGGPYNLDDIDERFPRRRRSNRYPPRRQTRLPKKPRSITRRPISQAYTATVPHANGDGPP